MVLWSIGKNRQRVGACVVQTCLVKFVLNSSLALLLLSILIVSGHFAPISIVLDFILLISIQIEIYR